MALADRFMDFLGKTFGKKDWRIWEIDVAKIIIHPGYNKAGRFVFRFIISNTYTITIPIPRIFVQTASCSIYQASKEHIEG